MAASWQHLILPRQIFVSRSYDATNHFESDCKDIKDLYRRIIGSEFRFGASSRHQSHNSDDDWDILFIFKSGLNGGTSASIMNDNTTDEYGCLFCTKQWAGETLSNNIFASVVLFECLNVWFLIISR